MNHEKWFNFLHALQLFDKLFIKTFGDDSGFVNTNKSDGFFFFLKDISAHTDVNFHAGPVGGDTGYIRGEHVQSSVSPLTWLKT